MSKKYYKYKILSFLVLILLNAIYADEKISLKTGKVASEISFYEQKGNLFSKGQNNLQSSVQAFVPLGAYWSWERIERLAEFNHKELWQYVKEQIIFLKTLNVNTIWVTNLSDYAFRPLLAICEAEEMKLIAALSSIQYRNNKDQDFDVYYDDVIYKKVKEAGDSQALIAWVLEDEPSLKQLDLMEKMRKKFDKFDPNRTSMVVTIRQVTPHLPKKTKFDILCSDLYPFFGPNDPNGPNTSISSMNWYKNAVEELIEASVKSGATPWVMSQCFVEVWGPWKYDKNWNCIALPGAYAHWINATVPQIRWQIWEAVRSGVRGFFFFTASPPVPIQGSEKFPLPDNAPSKEVLVKKPYNMGPSGMINPDGSLSEQGETIGQLYLSLKPYLPIISRWIPCKHFIGEIDGASFNCFIDKVTNKKYVVIVNEDLKAKKVFTIRTLKSNDKHVRTVELMPGDGAIIKW